MLLRDARMHPAPGVIVARPATAPVRTPTKLGLFSRIQEMISQVTIAADALRSVLMNAVAAREFAPKAPPALKPNQPNQSRAVP